MAFLPDTYAPRETRTYPPPDVRPHIPLKDANFRCLPLRGDLRLALDGPDGAFGASFGKLVEANECRGTSRKFYRNALATHYFSVAELEGRAPRGGGADVIDVLRAGDWEKVRAFDAAYVAAAPLGQRAAGRTVHDFSASQRHLLRKEVSM